jgi:hypothetical protein
VTELGRAVAAISVQVKPKTKSAANSDNNPKVERHDEQHEVVGEETVEGV